MAQDNPRAPLRIRRPLSQAAAGVLAGPLAGMSRPSLGLSGLGAWITRCLTQEIEQRRLFVWIPVCFGVGILAFFQAEGRPGEGATFRIYLPAKEEQERGTDL